MKIALAQINPCLGDLPGNCQKILSACHKAAEAKADLVIFPELCLLGYSPKDLLLRPDFLSAQQYFLEEIARCSPVPALVGAAALRDGYLPFNAVFLCASSTVTVVAKKRLLPNYNVFDEKRYFSVPDDTSCNTIDVMGKKILISICEDAWATTSLDGIRRYDFDPIKNGVEHAGSVDVIVNISASPYTKTKPALREQIFSGLAKTYGVPVLVVNQVGANDQWLFDGHTMIIDQRGEVKARTKTTVTDMLLYDDEQTSSLPHLSPTKTPLTLLHDVLVMGIRDYVEKCGLGGVVIGVSGGIDSAVVLALAVRALGARKVRAVYLPSRFSSPISYDDAYVLCHNLGVNLEAFLIEDQVQGLRELLADAVLGAKYADIVDQNLQARMRGLILMALSNANDHIMVATSNKSELAVGYATIYGDMCGAFAPIGDLYKGEVYQLACEINRINLAIPQSILLRAPTAELKADQLDSDSLPNYDELDTVLAHFIEHEKGVDEIEYCTKIDRSLIVKIISMVNRAEYKRRQGPFSLMVSDKVFGDARRWPIAKRFDAGGIEGGFVRCAGGV